MIWLLAGVALLAGAGVGFGLGRRFASTPMQAIVVSVALIVVVGLTLWTVLSLGDRTWGIVILSAGFGALTGVRYGGDVMTGLLSAAQGSGADADGLSEPDVDEPRL